MPHICACKAEKSLFVFLSNQKHISYANGIHNSLCIPQNSDSCVNVVYLTGQGIIRLKCKTVTNHCYIVRGAVMGQCCEPHFTHRSAVCRADKRSNKWRKCPLGLTDPRYGCGHVDHTTEYAMMTIILYYADHILEFHPFSPMKTFFSYLIRIHNGFFFLFFLFLGRDLSCT